MKNMKINWKIFIFCLVAVYATAFIGSIFTSGAVKSDWYESIKPALTPPSFVFPIVWNILFFLIALSLYFAFQGSRKKNEKRNVILVFSVNLILNILWSVLYFGLKNPLASFIEIFFLISSIILMIIITKKVSKKASYLLTPYLAWVCFAALLNYLSI